MNKYLFIFLTVFVLCLIIIIVYGMTTVNTSNIIYADVIDPFPDVGLSPLFPEDATKNCSNSLFPCDNDMNCDKKCGNDDYTCTRIDDGEEVVYNGIKVGKGNWCLPKNRKGCGKYTGISVWSGDSNDPTRGEWKCVCKYPQLFDGEYCLNNKACKDFSENARGISQSQNRLVDKDGNVWDPEQPNFKPPGGLSPLAKDENGNPIFTCRCGGGYDIENPKNIYQFVKLPNDPYYCHLDPCTRNSGSRTWDEENMTCNCGINMEKDTDGMCITPECPYGAWDKNSQECRCLGRTALVLCSSDNVKRTGINPKTGKKYPQCKDRTNENGMECIDRCIFDDKYDENDCIDKTCKKCIGGTCIFSGPGGEDISCNCGIGSCVNNDGFCVKNGKAPGEGCYYGLSMKLGGGDFRLPTFWIYDDGNRIKSGYMNYSNDALKLIYGFLDQDAMNELPVQKCQNRCLGSIAYPDEIEDIFSDRGTWEEFKRGNYLIKWVDLITISRLLKSEYNIDLLDDSNPAGIPPDKLLTDMYGVGGICGDASPCAG